MVSDNGADSEGGVNGSINEGRLANFSDAGRAELAERVDELGGPRAHNNYPGAGPWPATPPSSAGRRDPRGRGGRPLHRELAGRLTGKGPHGPSSPTPSTSTRPSWSSPSVDVRRSPSGYHMSEHRTRSARPFFADHGEELLQALDRPFPGRSTAGGRSPARSDRPASVPVAFGILDLIDADGRDPTELAISAPTSRHTRPMADLVPGRSKRHSRLLPRQLPGPMRQEQHVGLGQLVLADPPRNLLDPHTAVPAIDPSHTVEQHDHEAPQRDELESPLAQVIVAGRRPVAARAHRLRATAGPHGNPRCAPSRPERACARLRRAHPPPAGARRPCIASRSRPGDEPRQRLMAADFRGGFRYRNAGPACLVRLSRCASICFSTSSRRIRLSSAAFNRNSASWRRECRPETPAASSRISRRACGLAAMISPIWPCRTIEGERAPVEASANSNCTSRARPRGR